MKTLKSSSLKRQREFVAVETDGFSVLSTVMRMEAGNAKALAFVETREKEFSNALSSGVQQLRATLSKLPRKALLVAPDLFPAIIELPVDPAQPRRHAEMQEIVRWEIEPYFSQVVAGYPIGTILVGNGLMKAEQVSEVLANMATRKDSWSATKNQPAGSRSFGEIAVELGFVDRAQVKEALDLQARMRAPGEDYACGWTSVSSEQSAGQWRWLACAIDAKRREGYRRAFDSAGLELQRIYPLFGTSASSMNGKSVQQASILDIHRGALGHVELSPDATIESLSVHYHTQPTLDANKCIELARLEDKEQVWLSGRSRSIKELADELSSQLSGKVECVRQRFEHNGAAKFVPGFLGGVAGAVADAVGATSGGRSVCVEMRDPGPPLAKRPRLWWAAVIGVLLLAVGTLESRFYFQRETKGRDLLNLQAGLRLSEDNIRAIEEHNAAIEALRKKLDTAQNEHLKAGREKASLETAINAREGFPLAVLNALANSVNDAVHVERAAEHPDGTLEIDAWSLTEEALQRFAHSVLGELRDWQLVEKKSSVIPQVGRFELPGFALELELESPKSMGAP